jgi:hypothetical protein
VEAMFMNRILGGLPYPLWSWDETHLESHSALTGQCDRNRSYWRRVRQQVSRR